MSRIILYIAASVDGYIADADGGVSWLEAFNREGEDYGYAELNARVSTLILGANTYHQVLGFGEWPYTGKDTVVVTHHPLAGPPDPRIRAYSGPARELAAQLKRDAEGDIWLVGGGQIIGDFARAGLIDQYILFTMPLLLGDGVRLFPPGGSPQALRVTSVASYENGVIEARYVPAGSEPAAGAPPQDTDRSSS